MSRIDERDSGPLFSVALFSVRCTILSLSALRKVSLEDACWIPGIGTCTEAPGGGGGGGGGRGGGGLGGGGDGDAGGGQCQGGSGSDEALTVDHDNSLVCNGVEC